MSARPPALVGDWPVLRGWPRSLGHALLELDTPSGRRGAEWWSDARQAHEAAEKIPSAQVVGGVLVHPRHRDAKLPRFAERLAAGEQVVVHRPGRRAVLRGAGPQAPFTKVTRRRRAVDAIQRHESVASAVGSSVRTAPLLDHGEDWMSLGPLAGRSLLEMGRDGQISDPELAGAWHMLGRALRHLHHVTPDRAPGLRARHDAAEEVATTHKWLDPVLAWGLLPTTEEGRIEQLLDPLVHQDESNRGDSRPTALLHRDLHDQQVLIADGQDHPALLDLDTAAWGEPALDVANVLAHLDLRVRQDLLTEWRAGAAREAFLGALAPDAATRSRAEAYRTAARLRLSAVYALRPRWRPLALALFEDVLTENR